MPLGTKPNFSQVRTFFAGPTNLAAYVRGGAYVPNIAANSAISTTVAGLRLSQFSGADKASGPVMSPPYYSNSSEYSDTASSAELGVSFALNPSGGNGTYTYTVASVSQTGQFTNTRANVVGNIAYFNASTGGLLNGQTRTGTHVWRVTCTSNGQSTSIDLTCYYSYTRTSSGIEV